MVCWVNEHDIIVGCFRDADDTGWGFNCDKLACKNWRNIDS